MTKPNGEMVSLSRTDGKPFKGYLARPERSEGAPAIVVIQEWWGLNDQIRREADRLADCGYLALVPDLYHGKSAVVEEEAHHLMQGLDFGSAVAQEIRGAVDYLRAHASKVGIVGFCMGGALTMLSACAICTWTTRPNSTRGIPRERPIKPTPNTFPAVSGVISAPPASKCCS